LVPPIIRLVARLLDELSAVWNKTGCDLRNVNNIAAFRRTLTMPMFRSTVAIFLFASGFSSLLESGFSRARTTPFLQRMPMAVPPFSAAFMAYSTFAHQHKRQATRAERLLESFGHRERRRSLLSRSLYLLTSWAVRRSREEGNGEFTMIMKRGYGSRGDEEKCKGLHVT
jgi:hypothetical protein